MTLTPEQRAAHVARLQAQELEETMDLIRRNFEPTDEEKEILARLDAQDDRFRSLRGDNRFHMPKGTVNPTHRSTTGHGRSY